MKRLLFALPVALVLALVVAFAVRIGDDPSKLPSALLDRPVPDYALPAIGGNGPGVADEDLAGRLHLVNFWASWCVPCLAEHPQLARLAAEGVPIVGINYKDKPAEAAAWLAREGDPFVRTGADADGRAAIEFGVYGVPETFVVDAEGRIRHRVVGPVTPALLDSELRPLLRRLGAK